MREQLEIGKKYQLENNTTGKSTEIRITECVGYGATCIVYDGYYLDEYKLSHNVRLKECFPHYCTDEKRENGVVVWRSVQDKETSLERFKATYMQHIQLQKMFINTTTHAEELYGANDTLYILMDMDDGQSFDKAEVRNLHSLLKTLHALCATIKKYHERHLLHLDIKPENFMVIPETEELVKLFDFDSIVSMDEVNEGVVSELSYSERWAAPEVKQRRYRDIKETADIYSVGAVLFYYLVGRHYGVQDIISYGKYDWLKDCELLQGVNPVVRRHLVRFLDKTLASAVKMRYRSMEEVCAELKNLIRLADPDTMFLKSSRPRRNNEFVGRERELHEIHQRLQEQNCLLINGIGGIGKSELVKEYAFRYEKEHSHVVYISCTGSISDALLNDTNIVISNYSQGESVPGKRSVRDLVKERIAILKQVVEEDTLFVLDGIREFDDTLNLLLEVKCKFILTSREFPRALMRKREVYRIEEMPASVLQGIFMNNYTKEVTAEQESILWEIIREVNNYTFLVSIVAKAMDYYGIAPEVMLTRLKEDGIRGSAQGKVNHCKDGWTQDATVYEHMESLFDLSGMGEEEKTVLRALAVLEPYAVSKEFLVLCCISREDEEECERIMATVNRLIDLGWVCFDEEEELVYFHHAIAEACFEKLDCNVESCERLFNILMGLGHAIALVEEKKEENFAEQWVKKLDMDDSLRVYTVDEADYGVRKVNELIFHCISRLKRDNAQNLRWTILFSFLSMSNKDFGKRILGVLDELRIRCETPQIVGNEYYVMLCLAIIKIIEESVVEYSDADMGKICQCMKTAKEYGRKVTEWTILESYSQLLKYLAAQIMELYRIAARVLKGQKIPRSFFDILIIATCAMEGINEKKLSKEQRRELYRTFEKEFYSQNQEIEEDKAKFEEELSRLDNIAEEVLQQEEGEAELPEEEKKAGVMVISRLLGKTWNQKVTSGEVYRSLYQECKKALVSGSTSDYGLIRDILVEKEMSISDKASLLYYLENSPYDVYGRDLWNRNKAGKVSACEELTLVKSVLIKNRFWGEDLAFEARWLHLERALFFLERKQYHMFLGELVFILGDKKFPAKTLFAFGQFMGQKGYAFFEAMIYMFMASSHIESAKEEEDDRLVYKFYESYEACAFRLGCGPLVRAVRKAMKESVGKGFQKGIPTYGDDEESIELLDAIANIWHRFFVMSGEDGKQRYIEQVKRTRGIPQKDKEIFIQSVDCGNSFVNYILDGEVVYEFVKGSEQTIRQERKKLESTELSGFERTMSLAALAAEYLLLGEKALADKCIEEYCTLAEEVVNGKNSVQIMMLFELPDFIYDRTKSVASSHKIYKSLMRMLRPLYRDFGYYEMRMLADPMERCLNRIQDVCEKLQMEEQVEECNRFRQELQVHVLELEAVDKDDDVVEFCLASREDYSVPLKEYESRKFKEQVINGGVSLVKSLMKQMMNKEEE